MRSKDIISLPTTSLSVVKAYEPIIDMNDIKHMVECSKKYVVLPLLDVFLRNHFEEFLYHFLPLSRNRVIDFTAPFQPQNRLGKRYLARFILFDSTIKGIKLCTQAVELNHVLGKFHAWPKGQVKLWEFEPEIYSDILKKDDILIGDLVFEFEGLRLLPLFDIEFKSIEDYGNFQNQLADDCEILSVVEVQKELMLSEKLEKQTNERFKNICLKNSTVCLFVPFEISSKTKNIKRAQIFHLSPNPVNESERKENTICELVNFKFSFLIKSGRNHRLYPEYQNRMIAHHCLFPIDEVEGNSRSSNEYLGSQVNANRKEIIRNILSNLKTNTIASDGKNGNFEKEEDPSQTGGELSQHKKMAMKREIELKKIINDSKKSISKQ